MSIKEILFIIAIVIFSLLAIYSLGCHFKKQSFKGGMLLLFVQDLDGQKKPVELSPDATGKDLHQAVQQATRIPNVGLNFQGQSIYNDNSTTLADLGLSQEALIDMTSSPYNITVNSYGRANSLIETKNVVIHDPSLNLLDLLENNSLLGNGYFNDYQKGKRKFAKTRNHSVKFDTDSGFNDSGRRYSIDDIRTMSVSNFPSNKIQVDLREFYAD